MTDTAIFTELLQHLDSGSAGDTFQDWHIAPISGGANNLLYRVSGLEGKFAIKFTMRDARDRAGREYEALRVLQVAGLDIAPEPILLDTENYSQPVVIQSWLDGEVSDNPPQTDNDWRKLLAHYAAIYTVTPDMAILPLRRPVLSFRNVALGMARIKATASLIPIEAQPASLCNLIQRLDTSTFPAWPDPPTRLCRTDPNTLNFIRQPDRWASVDWEYAGWDDPVYPIGDMMSHPAYEAVSSERWPWIVKTFCSMISDDLAETRIWVYYALMLVWWTARSAQYVYQIPRGEDERLVARPSGALARAEMLYERYLQLAETELEKWGCCVGSGVKG